MSDIRVKCPVGKIGVESIITNNIPVATLINLIGSFLIHVNDVGSFNMILYI